MEKFGIFKVKKVYYWDGVEITPEALKEKSIDFTIDELTKHIEVIAKEWFFFAGLNEETFVYRHYTDFEKYLEEVSAFGLRYLFGWNGRDFLHLCDVARLQTHAGRWETIGNERDANGFYVGRNKEAYTERSGANGERYSGTFWTEAQLHGGSRHKRLRPSSFVNLDNIIPCGYADACTAFDVAAEADDIGELKTTWQIVYNFNEALKAHGLFLIAPDSKYLCAETVGGIAKTALLKYMDMYGVRNTCPLTPAQFNYLWKGKLMRGSINFINEHLTKGGEILNNFFGYDVNSEFLAVAQHLRQLGKLERSSLEEYESDETGKNIYILTFDKLVVELKRDAVPVLKVDGNNLENGIAATEEAPLCFFDKEIEELQNYYIIRDMHLHSVLKATAKVTPAFFEFAEEWYNAKKKAEREKNAGARFVCKMVINSALGKLAQKKVYGKVMHELSPDGLIKSVAIPATEAAEAQECGAFAYVQGAYVVAMARVFWMRRAISICGKNLRAHLAYGDTDSFYTNKRADLSFCGDGLGEMKTELRNGKARFLGLKCYAYYDIFGGHDIHIVGTPKADYIRECERILNRPATPQELTEMLNNEIEVNTTINIAVKGGRADVYRRRKIASPLNTEGHTFGHGRASFVEL